MTQFVIHPSIWQYDTCQAFAQDFHLGPQDLLLTNEFLYTPYFAPLNLPCPVLFQEKYGLGEPSDEMVEAIYRDMPKEVTRVIAVGGGGVLDIAKLLVLQHVTPILDLYDGKLPLQKARDLVLVPTTCGTGSEVTNISILNRTRLGTKQGLVSPAMFADHAVLIPEFLQSLPYSVFATSSIDALIHAVESYLSPSATPYTEMYSLQAMQDILRGYCQIAERGQHARFQSSAEYLRASNYAGIAFSNSGCAAVHAMSYALGGKYHVAHGESNYQFFTDVLLKYQEKKPDGKIRTLDHFLQNTIAAAGSGAELEGDTGIDLLECLLSKVLERKRMADYGVTREDIPVFAQSTIDNQQRLLKNNYVPLTLEDITAIYQARL